MNRVTLFRTTPRIVMGPGALNQLAEEVRQLKGKKVLFVTDKGVVEAGLLKPAREALEKAQIDYAIFDDVEPDPRYEIVAGCVEMIGHEKADLLIGFGGGSPIDIAKASAIMATNEGSVANYFGIDLVPNRGLPTIIVPTTAGTGSEVTPIVILSDEGEKLKKGIVTPYLFPSVALLDPELTLGLPPDITAATGMDALIHAIEAYTSVNATGMTDSLAFRAMTLLYHNIRTAYANGTNLEARSAMMEGSLLAGMAFANAGVTAVHAFAYPIGAEFHIPHGIANTLMLPHVMRFNLLGNLSKFAEISEAFDLPVEDLDDLGAAEMSVEAIERLALDLRAPKHLSEFGIAEKDLPALAEGVMKVTRLLANNPRTMTLKDAEEIYKAAL
ncbi:MAG: iron-containing alcohol dehydrogenase [Desulfobacterales bacterium]|nr:iron-containing alcohol dehydrogenase [Desulfobacterales bacterium]MBL7102452.1 iron-containing alcohol dehydrogenase [Desulfobacteraceae bacterium]